MGVIPIKFKDEWAKITTSFGTFISYNEPRFNEMYYRLTYQKDIISRLLTGSYDVFVDVGSYIGYFALIEAMFAKKTIAYEANPILYGILLNNCKFHSNVECKYSYVGKRGDIPKIPTNPFQMVDVRAPHEYNIPVVTLDDELLKYKGKKMFIKMDIEGGEKNALLGATELLKCDNIDWQVDIHYHTNTEQEIFDFFPNKLRRGHHFLCHKE